MKHVIIIALLTLPILGFTQEKTDYEYLTMIKYRTILFISIGTETFERVNLKDEVENKDYDFRPVHKRIEEFQNDGWEVVSGEQSWTGASPSLPSFTVFMRKKK